MVGLTPGAIQEDSDGICAYKGKERRRKMKKKIKWTKKRKWRRRGEGKKGNLLLWFLDSTNIQCVDDSYNPSAVLVNYTVTLRRQQGQIQLWIDNDGFWLTIYTYNIS